MHCTNAMDPSSSERTEAKRDAHERDAIARLDERLQRHDRFGSSPQITARVRERYCFGLELLSERDARLGKLVQSVEALAVVSSDALFGDVLVRAELEAALGALESSGSLAAHLQALRGLLGEALGEPSEPGKSYRPGVARRSMARDLSLGPDARAWVWNLPEVSTPVVDQLRESIRTGFMPGAESSVEIITPTPRMIAGLEQAVSLLYRLVPEMASSIFCHLHSLAVAHIRGPRGRMLTGSGGDGTPCMIFIDPDELDNPWDSAGHILHEGIHLKLSDLIRTGAIVTDEGLVELPWGRRTALSNCVFAYHAYAHMQVFRAAVRHAGPALHAEFGAPEQYRARTTAHAMSVVNDDSSAPFSRADQRLHHLHEQLSGALASRLTPVGRALVTWVWQAIHPSEVPLDASLLSIGMATAAARSFTPSADHAVRYRQERGLALRRAPAAESLFALEPRSGRIITLNLAAWLAFELCDGKTERELCEAYAATTGQPPETAWLDLAPALDELLESALVASVDADRAEVAS